MRDDDAQGSLTEMTMRGFAAFGIAVVIMTTASVAQAAQRGPTQNSAPIAGAPILGLVDLGPETKSP
jgi:hypothetical protein